MSNRWINLNFVMVTALIALMFQLATASTSADEFVIDDRQKSQVSLGDFNCSSCPVQVTSSLAMLAKENSGEVSAGELWKFFHKQGISSMDRLTLCLDVGKMPGQSSFDLHSFQFQIEDPSQHGKYLTHVSLGDNRLIIPSHGSSSYKPEAKLEVMLGYDFMERFSADSTEMIKLDFSSSGQLANVPIFSIEGGGNVFTRLNTLLLGTFVVFWLTVFYLLHRMTKPPHEKADFQKASSASSASPVGNSEQSVNRSKQVFSA